MESATLDLPGIDESMLATTAAPAAPKTEVATAAAGAIDLRKVDLEAVALAQFGDWKERAADVNARHGKTIFQSLETTKGFDALKKALAETKQVRFDGQNVADDLKSKMAKVSKAVGAKRDEISASIADTEKALQAQVDDETTRRNEAKRIAEEKAAARRQEFENKVAGIRNYLALAQGLPSPRIEKGVTFLTAMVIGDEWAEFKPIAQKALDETLASLRELLAKTQAAEVDAAERARIAEENERLRAENARIAAELAAQRAELQRQAVAVEDSLIRSFAENSRRIESDTVPYIEKAIRAYESVAPDWENDERPRVKAAFWEGREYLIMRLMVAGQSAAAPSPSPAEVVDKVLDDARACGIGFSRISADESGEVKVEHVSPREVYIGIDLASGPSQSAEFVVGPAIDVVHPDADEEGAEVTMLGGGRAIRELLAHIAKAFDTKFPSQPKPPVEWWAELKRLAAEVTA